MVVKSKGIPPKMALNQVKDLFHKLPRICYFMHISIPYLESLEVGVMLLFGDATPLAPGLRAGGGTRPQRGQH